MRAVLKIVLCGLACLFLPSTFSYFFGGAISAFGISIGSWTFYEILGFADITMWVILITATAFSISRERDKKKNTPKWHILPD